MFRIGQSNIDPHPQVSGDPGPRTVQGGGRRVLLRGGLDGDPGHRARPSGGGRAHDVGRARCAGEATVAHEVADRAGAHREPVRVHHKGGSKRLEEVLGDGIDKVDESTRARDTMIDTLAIISSHIASVAAHIPTHRTGGYRIIESPGVGSNSGSIICIGT